MAAVAAGGREGEVLLTLWLVTEASAAHASLRLQLPAELRCSLRSVNTDEYAPLAVSAIAYLDAYRKA